MQAIMRNKVMRNGTRASDPTRAHSHG